MKLKTLLTLTRVSADQDYAEIRFQVTGDQDTDLKIVRAKLTLEQVGLLVTGCAVPVEMEDIVRKA